jgi:hypothetical protein
MTPSQVIAAIEAAGGTIKVVAGKLVFDLPAEADSMVEAIRENRDGLLELLVERQSEGFFRWLATRCLQSDDAWGSAKFLYRDYQDVVLHDVIPEELFMGVMDAGFRRELDGWTGVCLSEDAIWATSTPDNYEELERTAIQNENRGPSQHGLFLLAQPTTTNPNDQTTTFNPIAFKPNAFHEDSNNTMSPIYVSKTPYDSNPMPAGIHQCVISEVIQKDVPNFENPNVLETKIIARFVNAKGQEATRFYTPSFGDKATLTEDLRGLGLQSYIPAKPGVEVDVEKLLLERQCVAVIADYTNRKGESRTKIKAVTKAEPGQAVPMPEKKAAKPATPVTRIPKTLEDEMGISEAEAS